MEESMAALVDKLAATGILDREELLELLQFRNAETTEYLFRHASMVRQNYFERKVTRWGRIPLSNYCKNDCNYCGIRRSNQFAPRFRLGAAEVLKFCREGQKKGIRHFLLESGVDLSYQEAEITDLIRMLRKEFQDSEVILSLGERNSNAYRHWFRAGASVYLMPQDTAVEGLFRRMHSSNMSLLRRKQNMWELQEIGYLTGAGFMIGVPQQTLEQVVDDLLFLKQFGAKAVTVVPFIPTPHTPFERERSGNGEMVLYLFGILRLMLPRSMIIADPSLGQTLPNGRGKALEAGVNVIITDLASEQIRGQYCVYRRGPERRENWMNEMETWVWE